MDPEKEELTGIARTAVLTLRARAEEHARADGVLSDPTATQWFARVQWPDALDEWYARRAQTNLALRADDVDHIIRRHLAAEPKSRPRIVELGAGLSTRAQRLADLAADWTLVDLPNIVAARKRLGATEHHVACSVTDETWLTAVPAGPHVIVAEGLLYYLPRPDVDALLARLADRFGGGVLIMDVVGALDYPPLRAQTEALGSPAQWCFEGNLDNAVEAFGLLPVTDMSPLALALDALKRYLDRVEPTVRAMSFFALQTGVLPATRSGNVIGRL